MSEIDSLFKYNCSTLFLLFPLGLDRRKLIPFGFKEVYIKDITIDDYVKNPVYVLFKPTDLVSFQTFVDSEYTRVNPHTETFDLVDDYDCEDGHVVLLYSFPEEFEGDFAKFMEGKYSKFSRKFKLTYPKIIKIQMPHGRVDEIIGTAYKIINKGEDVRREVKDRNEIDIKDELEKYFDVVITPDMELWQPPSTKDHLNIKEIIKNEQRGKRSNRKSKTEETDS